MITASLLLGTGAAGCSASVGGAGEHLAKAPDFRNPALREAAGERNAYDSAFAEQRAVSGRPRAHGACTHLAIDYAPASSAAAATKSEVATAAVTGGAHAEKAAVKIRSQDDLAAPSLPARPSGKQRSDARSSVPSKSAFAKKSAAAANPRSSRGDSTAAAVLKSRTACAAAGLLVEAPVSSAQGAPPATSVRIKVATADDTENNK